MSCTVPGRSADAHVGNQDCKPVRRRTAAALRCPPFLTGTGFKTESWRTYNRSFFDALFVEKLMMMILIGIIFIVVGFNVYHSLRRSVFERMEEIAVLKAVGIPPRRVQAIFILEGLFIGLAGGAGGLIAGLVLAVNVSGVFAVVEGAVNWALRLRSILLSAVRFGGLRRHLRDILSHVFLPDPGAVPRVSSGSFPCLFFRRDGMHGRRVGRHARHFPIPTLRGAAL